MPNAAGADTINPETLKAYRKAKGYRTQAELADKLGCRVDQVNRWETGRTKKPNSKLLKQLTDALGVRWEDLTRPPQEFPKNPAAEYEDPHTIQLNRRVRRATRTALELVSRHYHVSWRDILELAPLLFHICAKQSLSARKKALDEALARIDEAESAASSTLPYLRGRFPRNRDNPRIKEEEDALKMHQVFTSYEIDGNDFEYDSPFVNYLMETLAALGSSDFDISPTGSRSAPFYKFPDAAIKEKVDITGEGELEKELLEFIQDGEIDFQEVLSKKEKLDAKSYRDWLAREHQMVREKIEALGLEYYF